MVGFNIKLPASTSVHPESSALGVLVIGEGDAIAQIAAAFLKIVFVGFLLVRSGRNVCEEKTCKLKCDI